MCEKVGLGCMDACNLIFVIYLLLLLFYFKIYLYLILFDGTKPYEFHGHRIRTWKFICMTCTREG